MNNIVSQVDMIMNEFDDERTIDEEETMTQEDEAEELNALKDEQDIPIEELLKMYGYNKDAAKDPAEAGGPSQAAEEAEADPEDEEEEEEGDEGEEKTEVEKAPAEEKEEKEDEVVVTQVQTTNDNNAMLTSYLIFLHCLCQKIFNPICPGSRKRGWSNMPPCRVFEDISAIMS